VAWWAKSSPLGGQSSSPELQLVHKVLNWCQSASFGPKACHLVKKPQYEKVLIWCLECLIWYRALLGAQSLT
jgi:hypothetical protein